MLFIAASWWKIWIDFFSEIFPKFIT